MFGTNVERGRSEIGSCIFKYLKETANKVNDENLKIILFSYNYGAQQKNRYMVAVLLYAVLKLKIKKITHKYLIVGHTQNEGDASHSVLKKRFLKH